MYHHHSQQEEPPQPFSNRPRPFNHQEQAHQQQQQQHSHFQYPPIKGSRDTDMESMNMDTDMYLDRMNGSGSGGFSSSLQPLSESQPGHKRVVLERVVLDWSNYQHPDQMFSSSNSTLTQQPQSSHSAMGMQHEPPSPQTRGSHSGGVDGQGVRERAGSILASFGLSSQDLEVLSQYPEDQITPDKLPYIIQDMLSRKSNYQKIAASFSSYSQSATRTVRETPPPSCSHGSSGRRRSPEVSGICIDYGHSSRTTIDYGHSSLPTIVSSSREAFIREPLLCESLSAAERKKEKRPPVSSLPKQEMDVTPERWQFCPQPPVPNKHGDLDYCKSSSTFHKSKRSPTAECPLPPRSRRSDLDYRRDSPKRSPSSETQSDYSSSSRRPAPWSSVSKPRDDTKRLPTPSMICDYSAESPKDWIDHVESVKHTESYRDLHDNSFSAHMTGGGGGGGGGVEEPPQLAQDKARLEKEYLSLMAALGEEPVFFSGGGGGHNDNQGGGGGNDSNNQPPPESPDKDKDIPTAPTAKEEDSIPKDPDYPEILYSNGKVIGYHCKLCHVRVEIMNDTEVNVHFKSKDHQVKWIRRLKSLIKSLSKKDKRNAEPHATIYTSQDEHVKEVSSLSKKEKRNAEPGATIHTSQDEHVEEVSSGLRCKLCKCFLPKGAAAIKAHLTGKRHAHLAGKRHAKHLLLLDPERKPNAPRREQHSLGQDDIPTTRERSATPDDDSASRKPPPASTELKHSSEDWIDNVESVKHPTIHTSPDEQVEEVSSRLRCKLCQCFLPKGAAAIKAHLTGKRHLHLLLLDPERKPNAPRREQHSLGQDDIPTTRERSATPDDDSATRKPPPSSTELEHSSEESPDNGKESHTVLIAEEEDSSLKDPDYPETFSSNGMVVGYHCKLCDIRVETAKFYLHFMSKKHNVLLIQSQSLRSLYLAKYRDNLEDICRAESIVVVDNNPLTVSYCELCKFFFPKRVTKQGIPEHLNGKQHVTSLWNKMKSSIGKDGTAGKAPRFSAHLEEHHLQELYQEIEANLGKKYNINAAEHDAMIYICRDEHIEDVSSDGKAVLHCKLCQSFLPKGASINCHLMAKRHVVSLRQLEERRKEESLAESEELHRSEAAGKELSGSHSQAEVKETENVEQMEEDEEEETAASVSVKRLMSDDKRREEEPMQKKQKTQADNPPPPFDPNSADDGMEFLVPKPGFFCQVCNSFFSVEQESERSHCKSLEHNTNLQKYLQSRKTSS